MNARVLELLQRPENISKEDISLLQNEISKFPYMQSIRTLHLSAIFNFDAENYQKELTKTAAYTTDKKILYTFINKKNEEEKKLLGIQMLPENLGEAIKAMGQDTLVSKVLGETYRKGYMKAKRKEWKDYLEQVSEWELNRYLYRV